MDHGHEKIPTDERPLKILPWDCGPSKSPLKISYYHGTSSEPLCALTIGQILEEAAAASPEQIVFRTSEFNQTLSIGQLQKRADVVSKSLLALGLKKGDIVLILDVDDIEFFVLYFAVTQIGMIFFAPFVQEPYKKSVETGLEVSPTVVIVGKTSRSQIIATILAEHSKLSAIRFKIILQDTQNGTRCIDGIIDYSQFLDVGRDKTSVELQMCKNRVSCDDVAFIFSSSGSTGEQKQMCYSHFSLVNLIKFGYPRVSPYQQDKEVLGVIGPTQDDLSPVVQNVGPLLFRDFHVTVVMAPSNILGNGETFMKFVEKERITWYAGMPGEFVSAINSPNFKKYDLSSLRGGILVAQAVSEEAKKRLLGYYKDMVTCYGGSENLAGLSTSAALTTADRRLKTVGIPFPHVQVKIVDENEVIVPVGKAGHICLRSHYGFSKILNKEEMTMKTKGLHGWIKLGDIGSMDETGHVTYVGRSSDCVRFKHNGEQVYPSFILEAIKDVHTIKEAKVVGIPSDLRGDDIVLCIEPRKDCVVTEEDIRRMCEQNLLEEYRPDYYFIFEVLPRSGFRNKVSLRNLTEMVEERIKSVTVQKRLE